MGELVRGTRARIHMQSLTANLEAIRAAIPADTMICAAVKANAYGHGAIPVSGFLRRHGVEFLGVSSPDEGAELREAGDQGRILLFGPTIPDEVNLSLESRLDIMTTDAAYLSILEDKLSERGTGFVLSVHLKVDTGMNRVGCRPEDAVGLAKRISEHSKMHLAGIATHYPSADSVDEKDLMFTAKQTETLRTVVTRLQKEGIQAPIVHAANSGAVALSPDTAFQMVRPGIALYGYGQPVSADTALVPVMELITRITAIKKIYSGETVSYGRTWKAERDGYIATVPIGYADGYSRGLSNRSEVLIGGRRYPVAGTVCMDQTMIDLGPICDVELYDEVVLFGPDHRGPDAEEIAALLDTIPYEITCGISARVPRIYVENSPANRD